MDLHPAAHVPLACDFLERTVPDSSGLERSLMGSPHRDGSLAPGHNSADILQGAENADMSGSFLSPGLSLSIKVGRLDELFGTCWLPKPIIQGSNVLTQGTQKA